MLCPKCVTENTIHAVFCINCHEHFVSMSETTSDKDLQNSKRIDLSETPIPNIERLTEETSRHSRIHEKPAVSTGLNIAIIFGTIIFPIIGIAMLYLYEKRSSGCQEGWKKLVNVGSHHVRDDYSISQSF